MAGQEGGEERNLPPSARRLSKLRQDGQVPRSKDFETAVSLVVSVIYLVFAWNGIFERFKISFLVFDVSMPQGFLNEMVRASKAQFQLLFDIVLPIFAIVTGAHLVAMILDAQGIVLNFKAVSMNISKLNPVQGVKQLFSLKNLFDLLKGIVLIIAVITANIFIGRYFLNDLVWSPSCGESCVFTVMIWVYGCSIAVGLLLLIIVALIDLPISRLLFKRDNKMTVSEQKREQKEDSGAPEIRQARKEIAQQIAQSAGHVGLSKADILIAFGDQAVALTFKQNVTAAPILAARTRANGGEFIKEAALRKMPIFEEPELLLKLLDGGGLGDYIPQDTFNDVARLLIQAGVVKV